MSIPAEFSMLPSETEEREPSPGDWLWDKPSRAVVARGPDGCAVIAHVGAHVADQIDALGSNNEEVFDTDPPLGISIFEGRLSGGQVMYTMEGTDYGDVYLTGEFREPTSEEWDAIRAGHCPWNPDDWKVPGLPTEAP